MHVRIPRAEAEAFASEATRRGITLRQLVRDRLVPPPPAVDPRRVEVVRQLGQIGLFGGDALERTLKAMMMCPPDAFVLMEAISSAVIAAHELGRSAAPTPTPTPTPTD